MLPRKPPGFYISFAVSQKQTKPIYKKTKSTTHYHTTVKVGKRHLLKQRQ